MPASIYNSMFVHALFHHVYASSLQKSHVAFQDRVSSDPATSIRVDTSYYTPSRARYLSERIRDECGLEATSCRYARPLGSSRIALRGRQSAL